MEPGVGDTLPPCRICEEKGSGFHYGVNSCEACKAFFKRSLGKGAIFECAYNRCCNIIADRNSCVYCRYQKCLQVGMCKDAIKTGRYSHEKKALNIRESRKLKNIALRKSQSEESQHEQDNRLEILSLSASDNAPVSVCDSNSIGSGSVVNCDEISEISSPNSDDINTKSSSSTDLLQNSMIHVDRSVRDCRQTLFDNSKIDLYNTVIDRMHEKIRVYACEDMNIDESLSEKQIEYLEMVELKKKIFGSLKPMSGEEYMKFFEETGIDIDGRHEIMKQVLPLIEYGTKQHIEFAKTIPGFRDLSLNDQIALVKASRSDFFMIVRHKCFSKKFQIYTTAPFGQHVYHFDELRKIKDEHVEPIINMQLRIRSLNLTGGELAVLSAVVVMCPDGCELEDPEQVERSRDFLLECLFFLFHKHHPADKQRFSRVVTCLTDLRNLREDSLKFEDQMLNMWWGHISFPPLLTEMWTK